MLRGTRTDRAVHGATSAAGRRTKYRRATALARRVGASTATVAAAGGLSLMPAPASAATTASVTSFSQSVTHVDVTRGSSSVTVTLQLVDPQLTASETPYAFVDMTFTPSPNAQHEIPGVETGASVGMTLTSGTWANGTLTGTYPLPAGKYGAWGFTDLGTLVDLPGGAEQLQSLALPGAVPVTAVVTAPPVVPTNIKSGLTSFYSFGHGIVVRAEASWTNPDGEPFEAVADSISGSGCSGLTTANVAVDADGAELPSFSFGLCTMKFHVYNDGGSSPEFSTTSLL